MGCSTPQPVTVVTFPAASRLGSATSCSGTGVDPAASGNWIRAISLVRTLSSYLSMNTRVVLYSLMASRFIKSSGSMERMPSTTVIGLFLTQSFRQCAAVSTQRGAISEPPHRPKLPPPCGTVRYTCHGHFSAVVAVPPTTRRDSAMFCGARPRKNTSSEGSTAMPGVAANKAALASAVERRSWRIGRSFIWQGFYGLVNRPTVPIRTAGLAAMTLASWSGTRPATACWSRLHSQAARPGMASGEEIATTRSSP